MERFFHLKEHNTDVKTEVIAGITTFLTMAYILAVNPNILGAVMDRSGVFIATAVASAIATFIMAFYANYPIALSAGLGLNAYFVIVCQTELKDVANPFTICLTAVLVEGLIFILLSFFKAREQIINVIPMNLKNGISAGIGLFVAYIGLQSAGIVQFIWQDNGGVLIQLGSFSSPQMVLALIGFIITVVLVHYDMKGAVLVGILATWILGLIAEFTGWYQVGNGNYSLIPDFSTGFQLSGITLTAFHFNFSWVASHLVQFIAIVFSFLYVDIFDTVGTIVGVADKAGLLDKDGKLPKVGNVLMADAIGTVTGACLGTSTITSFVESSAGVAAGGRTGLTAFVTGIMFLLSLLLSPVFLAIPGFATAPALVYVGMLMVSSAKKIDFESDIADTVGAYMAMLMMPLCYSIATGIMFSILTWVLIKTFEGKVKEIHPVMWIIFLLFAIRICTLVFNFQ